MTKDELVALVHDEVDVDVSHEAVAEVIDEAITAISNSLAEGDIVRLGPLGSFVTRAEGEHQVHVPRHEDLVTVPAQNRVLFHPSKTLKAVVNGGEEPAEPGA